MSIFSAVSWRLMMLQKLRIAVLAASLVCVGNVRAQTAQQLEIFNSLSSDQQQTILQSLGKGTATTGQSTSGTGTSGTNATTVTQRSSPMPVLSEEQRRSVLLQSRSTPALQPGDTVLLSVTVKSLQSDLSSAQQTTSTVVVTQGQATQVAQSQLLGGNKQSSAENIAVTPSQSSSSSGAVFKAVPDQTQIRQFSAATDNSASLVDQRAADTERLEGLRERVLNGNPYRLDSMGVLNLPGVNPIPLGNLSVDEAMERLNADPLLLDFNIGITLLPVSNPGGDSLKLYGYDLFSDAPSTFAPATDIPVPSDYVVGPDDILNVQLIGNNNNVYSLVVGRDGQVNFPTLGPISVAGLSFDQVRTTLEQRVSQQMIGTQVSVTLGALRSIRVFVLGDVQQPGSYTVSGLSTLTNALLVSGGVKAIGSLRKVQLKRSGAVVTTMDLYDLLLQGDSRADARLLPGDVIFVPPIGSVVGVSGQIKRPAKYELKDNTTVGQLIELAGGLTADSDGGLATIERIDVQHRRVTVNVDVSSDAGRATQLKDGDVLNIPQVRPTLENSVLLDGNVYRPGSYQYREGMRLTDLLSSIDELKPNSDLHYVLIRRQSLVDQSISVFSADFASALAGAADANVALQTRDRVYVFDLDAGRDRVIQPLLRELRIQANRDTPTQSVRIAGSSNVEGEYPLEPNMRISDLLRAGGGLDESAYERTAELTRYDLSDGEVRKVQVLQVDLASVRAGNTDADLLLQPFDYLLVKKTPLWNNNEYVDISGEVRFPGRYPIQHGESLRSVIERAGGLTDLAFPFGAAFTRVELRQREQEQLAELANRMQLDLAQVSLQAAQSSAGNASQALAVGQSLLSSLKSTQPVGRLVIDINKVESASVGSLDDIILKDGDGLVIPRIKQEVTVLGEVQSTTSHLYKPGLSLKDYINLSGGITRQADKGHIYVVRANGSVQSADNFWFTASIKIQPGDTVVVPLNAYKIRALPLWTSVTQIIYNLAIAAAAVNSF